MEKLCRGGGINTCKLTLTEVPCLSNTVSHELPGSQSIKGYRMSFLIFPQAEWPVRYSSVCGAFHVREQNFEHIHLGF